MNQGVHVMDLVFIRVLMNFIISWGTVRASGKHVIRDVPKEMWGILFVRCCTGTVGFTCLVYSLKTIPLFISIIIFNTAPFITSLMGYIVLGDKVSKLELGLMLGCFTGVISLALAKGGYFEGNSGIESKKDEKENGSIDTT